MDLSLYNPQSHFNKIVSCSVSTNGQGITSNDSHTRAKAENCMKRDVDMDRASQNSDYLDFISNMHHFEIENYSKQLNKTDTNVTTRQSSSLSESNSLYITTQNDDDEDNNGKSCNSSNTSAVGTSINQTTEELLVNSSHKKQSNHNHVYTIRLRNQPLVCLNMDGVKRLCLAQISSTLLSEYSYNEIHNRRVALGITCVQCTPNQLELLREFGAMPTSSRRCGTITYREAERLIKSFLDEPEHPKLPENFVFQNYFSPNKFIFHCHSPRPNDDSTVKSTYRHPDAANFNAWRRHLYLLDPNPPVEVIYAWEDVKAMFNGGNRKRVPVVMHTAFNTTNSTINSNNSVNDYSGLNDSLFTVSQLAASSTPNLEHDCVEANSKRYKSCSSIKKWNDDDNDEDIVSYANNLNDLPKPVKSTGQQRDSLTSMKKPRLNFMIENVIKSQPKRKTTRNLHSSKLYNNSMKSHAEYADYKKSQFQAVTQNSTILHDVNFEKEDFILPQNSVIPVEANIYNFTSNNLNKIEHLNVPKDNINTNTNTLLPYTSLKTNEPQLNGDMTALFLNTWPSLLLFKNLMYNSGYPTQLHASPSLITEIESSSEGFSPFHSEGILNLVSPQQHMVNTVNESDMCVANHNLVNKCTLNLLSSANQKNSLVNQPLNNSISALPPIANLTMSHLEKSE
ncbi:unnamed protein product [Heterobilharzia americana]|nr:unnamed protein product [Heterobilharzia americana]